MAKNCKTCGKTLENKKDLYCPRHAIETLKNLESSGYLEPMEQVTIDGPFRLSPRRFQTLPEMEAQSPPNSRD